ncbi:unnamed protein product [Brassica napus]|uniref:(rape) hypothetical protein n=1 Tax=Brassica napus TaxID=3708 RepID=A0A816XEZ6_BRANA|nr:unnamed protein product [Brassica napus]
MESFFVEAVNAIWWIVVVGIIGMGYHAYGGAVVEQWRMRRYLRKQGVKGPPPSIFNGNVSEMKRIQSETKHYSGDNIISHDYSSSIFPYFEHWRKQYTVTMVIQETRRLYPPTPIVGREAFTDIRLGNLVVPKGVCIWILIPALHRHGEIWGEDANEFKPERFSEGISKACKYPQSYMPFGFGPRTCLGKNLAMMEAKVLVSLIVSKFSFTLSPTYQHSPNHKLLVEPQHGVVIRIVRQ